MAVASDYPVTFPYGATSPPYGTLANPYHRGDDHYMPVGTPVLVNGIQIGLSGQTGWVTGPHLHVGRFSAGHDTNPNGAGFTLTSPVTITDFGYNATDGNYVGLSDGGGFRWVYLHLNSSNVKVGQVLQGGTSMGQTPGQLDQLIKMGKQDEPRPDELNNPDWLANANLANDAIWNGYGKSVYANRLQTGDIDNLLKDVGITPTADDYAQVGLSYRSVKDFAYWLQGRIKNGVSTSGFKKVGTINGVDVYEKGV